MKALFPLTFLVFLIPLAHAEDRHYSIGIRETAWDYAITGRNMLNGKVFSEDQTFHSGLYLQRGPDRIGSVYKKALYYQYTDDTFQTMIEKPSWLGFLGPLLKAETGDYIYIHTKNFASRPYSIHPHGLTYTKENEGALYPDNSTRLQKEDDHVKPGEDYTYRWYVDENQGPGPSDSNCVIRLYHSHFDTVKDVAAGLVGPVLTCKKGTLHGDIQINLDRSYILLFSTVDENNSWYIDDNINAYTEPGTVNTSDPEFQESNKMHAINGYMYGNLPNLTMCEQDRVSWYFLGMGDVSDTHPIYLHGQTLIYRNHRKDTITVFPASMEDAFMVAKGPGEWLLGCPIYESMQAFFNVRNCQNTSTNVTGENVIHYYIAAEEILWNYAPSGIDFFTGKKLTAPESESKLYFEEGATRIGGTYKKIAYLEYTDASFTKQKSREEHLGILGPVIKAEVGQTIRVTFYNNASLPLSIQPHGLHYSKSNEGSFYLTPGESSPAPSSHVNPGTTFVYTWHVPTNVGPTSTDPDCLTWIYYSSMTEQRDTSSGLVGPLLVCRNGSLGEDGKQKGVDKEFYLLATIFDENKSYLLDENIRTFTTQPENVDKEDPDFQNSNMMYSINGYMYGNLPGLDMCVGDKVSWHVLSVGSESDLHGIYFSGNTFTSFGSRMDTATVVPHISQTLSMIPDSSGIFNVVCMTAEHYQGGMKHKYQVRRCPKPNPDQTHYQEVKTIYIAAEEIMWDFAPSKKWKKQLYNLQRKNKTSIYLNGTGIFLGSKYKKVVYRQYDDITFTNQTKRSEDEKHLDILGPLIFLNPGNILRILFKNKASRPYSIHAHGVRTNYSTVVPTQPGEIQTYTWQIPERTGPTSNDFECIPWVYYSTVDFVKDLNSGLIGSLIICRKNTRPSIVHRVLLFMIFNENRSWYFEENISAYSSDPNNIDREDDDFDLSNQMHAINGRVFGNNQGLTLHVGDEVNWYLIGLGGEFDLHTVHFHGHSFQYTDFGIYRSDVYNLPPGTYQTVKMFPVDVGTWLFHCHVNSHIEAGMESTYSVIEREDFCKV
ncbi:PREDICTED: ceruloplasmin-like [Chrysochloris asiatica]|uniref:ferroxidase n=1 Tax=Chrysochloris asiatica TaxID=185453 RepID=A0A9B0U5U7_CHRAS|nr:PREDICTED: ceruloplasmin-like [Chrysochloris asiatica]